MTDFLKNIEEQYRVKNILSTITASSNIPHALLFTGNEGVGKDNMAIRFAQSIIMNFTKEADKERIINQVSSLAEPYIKIIIPLPRGKNETESDGPTDKLSNDDMDILKSELQKKILNHYHTISIPRANTIKINSIRDIKKFLSLNYNDIEYRFVIITTAHQMNEAAQNALLKNLEEPPKGVIFILITPYPSLLRETIRSRCWNINFDPLTNDELINILVNNFEMERDIAELVTPFAEGSISSALKLVELDIESLCEQTISILRYSFGKKYHSAFNELNSLLKDQSAENIQLIVKMIIIWMNDLQKQKLNINHYFFKKYKDTLIKFNSKFPEIEVNDFIFRIDRLSSFTKKNINTNLLLANVIFELSALTTK